jgi:hypothetical protein
MFLSFTPSWIANLLFLQVCVWPNSGYYWCCLFLTLGISLIVVVHKKCSLLNGRIFFVPRSINLRHFCTTRQGHPSTFSLSLPLNDWPQNYFNHTSCWIASWSLNMFRSPMNNYLILKIPFWRIKYSKHVSFSFHPKKGLWRKIFYLKIFSMSNKII